MNELFRKFAHRAACTLGSPWAFVAAVGLVLLWAATGPMFGFSDTWQLVINTGTTIVTFLMVFAIQNSQNRDARAIHLKLDELIRAVNGARNGMVSLETLSDDELDAFEREFQALAAKYGVHTGPSDVRRERASRRRERVAAPAERP